MAFDPGFGRVVPGNVPLVMGGGWRDTRDAVPHQGVDLSLPVGTPILAAASGVATRVQTTDAGDAGIFVGITHPSGLISRYLHFSSVAVALGQKVSKGQLIGHSGNTGNSSGPHLHFDLKVLPGREQLLRDVTSRVGTPATGFGPNILNTGFGFPAEPWLPVDQYKPVVVTNAKAQRIPLYPDVPRNQLIKFALVGVLAWGTYKLVLQ